MPQENVYNQGQFIGQISFEEKNIISIGSRSSQKILNNTAIANQKDGKYYLQDGQGNNLGFIEKSSAEFRGL